MFENAKMLRQMLRFTSQAMARDCARAMARANISASVVHLAKTATREGGYFVIVTATDVDRESAAFETMTFKSAA